MQRTPEPERMDDPEQARAYANGDFAAPHQRFIDEFRRAFPGVDVHGPVLDIGCGPGDVALRFAGAFPNCEIDGIDAAPAMLAAGDELRRRHPAGHRLRVSIGDLRDPAPRPVYPVILCNSLLHHLHDPQALWAAVRRHAHPQGTRFFLMDLFRPDDESQLQRLVETYATHEPPLLRRDFEASLKAAFRPEEIRRQLQLAGLAALQVETISDRHVLVYGTVSGEPDNRREHGGPQ